ncbi:MAG: hypothetical protein AAF589_05660 [Planctomycetota bacterium]
MDIKTMGVFAQFATAAILLGSSIAIWRQLRISSASLVISRRMARRDQFSEASRFDEKLFDAIKLHLRDHMLDRYVTAYDGDDTRLRSYSLTKQKYMYLVFHHDLEDEFGTSASRWLSELIGYREFRHVHRSHARYYVKFAEEIDRLIEESGNTNDQDLPWLCGASN